MRIKEFSLKNIYQHRLLEAALTGGIIGVVGENGSGKSNLLQALGECYHGEFHQDKDRIVTWGADHGRIIVVTEMPDGSFFTIKREFPSGAAELTCGSEKVTGPAKVNAWVLKKLRTDKGMLQNLVFVGQQEIAAILFSRPTEKDRLAQKFFNLGGASIIEQALTKSLSGTTLDSMASRLDTFKADRLRASIDLSELRGSLEQHPRSEDLEAEVAVLDARVTMASALNSVIDSVLSLLPVRDAANTDYAAKDRLYRELYNQHLVFDAEACAISRDLHQRAQTGNLERATQERRLSAAQGRRPGIGLSPHSELDLLKARQDLEDLSNTVAGLDSRRVQIDSMLNKMGTESACGACGAPIDISSRPHLEANKAELEGQLAPLRDQLRDSRRSMATMESSQKKWDDDSAAIEAVVREASERLSVLPPLSDFTPNPLSYQAQLDQHAAGARRLREMYDEMTAVQIRLGQVDAKILDLRTGFPGMSLVAESKIDISLVQAQLLALRENIKVINSLEERVRAAQTRFSTTNEMLADAQKAVAANEAVRHIRQALDAARAVFHPNGAPKVLVTRSSRMLEARINHYLEMMGSKFTITPKDGLNFDANFINGIARDSELSVGQKAALAWSFRLAGCETFTSSVGLMTMDEPTATLDASVLSGFLMVIGVMKQLAVSHGMQFFIATHSSEVERECDQIIRIA